MRTASSMMDLRKQLPVLELSSHQEEDGTESPLKASQNELDRSSNASQEELAPLEADELDRGEPGVRGPKLTGRRSSSSSADDVSLARAISTGYSSRVVPRASKPGRRMSISASQTISSPDNSSEEVFYPNEILPGFLYRPGPLGAFNLPYRFHSKSIFYGAFVWARGAINRQKRRFPARAVGSERHARCRQSLAELGITYIINATVRALPGRLSGVCVPHSISGWHGAFVWRTGRLTVQNGGFRPGQWNVPNLFEREGVGGRAIRYHLVDVEDHCPGRPGAVKRP
jgi:hypothetical protein